MIFLNIKNKNTGNKNKNVQMKNTWLPIAVGSVGLPAATHTGRPERTGLCPNIKWQILKQIELQYTLCTHQTTIFNLLNGNALTFYFTLSNARWFYSSSEECCNSVVNQTTCPCNLLNL
jgi:hypothetical protein